jgi:hypothetical protein
VPQEERTIQCAMLSHSLTEQQPPMFRTYSNSATTRKRNPARDPSSNKRTIENLALPSEQQFYGGRRITNQNQQKMGKKSKSNKNKNKATKEPQPLKVKPVMPSALLNTVFPLLNADKYDEIRKIESQYQHLDPFSDDPDGAYIAYAFGTAHYESLGKGGCLNRATHNLEIAQQLLVSNLNEGFKTDFMPEP